MHKFIAQEKLWNVCIINYSGIIRTLNFIRVSRIKFYINFIFYVIAEEQDALQASSNTAQPSTKRKRQPRKCRKYGQPVKDHNDQACKSMQR